MCGIFGYVGSPSLSTSLKELRGSRKLRKRKPSNNAAKIVFEGLKRLEYRGYDSWGLAVKVDSPHLAKASRGKQSGKSKLVVEKHVGKIGNSTLPSKLSTLNSNLALGHTRWATHGEVTVVNAHPHLDCSETIAIVHNGIVENFQELKKELIGKGHKFHSQTDSEIFAHLVEEYLDSNSSVAVFRAFRKLKGRNAFVVLFGKERQIIGVRSGSPLVLGIGKGEFFLASDVPAFLKYTRDVVFLDDGEGVVIDDSGFEVWDVGKNRRIKKKTERIAWKLEQAQKGKYAHFLLKEIMEQPTSVRAAIAQSEKEIEKLATMINAAHGSYLVACGTASYAAFYGTYVFSSIAKKHINWAIGSEFANYQHFIDGKTLAIAVSQSGETADTLEAVKIAREKGAKTVAIVNVVGSSLARSADFSILTNAGPEIAVVSTKAFTAQLSLLLLLAYAAAGKFKEGKILLEKTAKSLEIMLNGQFLKKIKKLAGKLNNSEHIYVIGKGQNFPIALEAALKIKEASYIHGEGFAAGELKHGVITLIEKGTPCLVLLANDDDRDYVLSSAMEMKARGGYILGIGPQRNEVFDEFIRVPNISQTSAILNTPPVQLLAYFLAVLRGNNPDKPRNLAKSVTVK